MSERIIIDLGLLDSHDFKLIDDMRYAEVTPDSDFEKAQANGTQECKARFELEDYNGNTIGKLFFTDFKPPKGFTVEGFDYADTEADGTIRLQQVEKW